MHRFLGLIACHCHFNTFSNLRPIYRWKWNNVLALFTW